VFKKLVLGVLFPYFPHTKPMTPLINSNSDLLRKGFTQELGYDFISHAFSLDVKPSTNRWFLLLPTTHLKMGYPSNRCEQSFTKLFIPRRLHEI